MAPVFGCPFKIYLLFHQIYTPLYTRLSRAQAGTQTTQLQNKYTIN